MITIAIVAFVAFAAGYFAASWVISADFNRRVRNFEADPLTRFNQEMEKIRRVEAQKMRDDRDSRLAEWNFPAR